MRNMTLSSFIVIILTILTKSFSIDNANKRTLLSSDNVCTFHIADKLFSLIYLQSVNPYYIPINQNETIWFNFCTTFTTNQCQNTNITQNNPDATINITAPFAFAYYMKKQMRSILNTTTNQTEQVTVYNCTPYTSDSYVYYFSREYIKHNENSELVLNLTTTDYKKATEFHLFCSEEEYFDLDYYNITNNNNKIVIVGYSAYGCPVFQISSLWTALQDNQFILGIIIFVLGFQLLFYGLLMINVTVFITGYFISFAVLGGLFTVFLGPDSSSIAVYFALLLILLGSTLIAYGLTKLINVSIFFIGAFFGLIVGALVNTFFCSVFGIYSVWSLVIFQILFTIPCGLLTFKYSNQVIILSTSLTGSYLIIRPISWIIGGFPNEFVLYQMYQSRQLSSVPWSFYIYLFVIIAHAIMGALYQYLKLQRQDPSNTIMTNIVTDSIQQPLDKIKSTVDKLIARYSHSDGGQQNYKKMKEMQYKEEFMDQSPHATQYTNIQVIQDRKLQQKKRNSKDQQFF